LGEGLCMKIAIGADHRGYDLKKYFLSLKNINSIELQWIDCGTYSSDRTDYPIYSKIVAQKVQNNEADAGILICGTGTGMAIAANRFTGIHAAVLWNPDVACASKEDDNVNIVVLPADYLTQEQAYAIVSRWLQCSFKHDHYAERLAMIDE